MKLEETHSEEEIRKCQEANYPTWGKPLSLVEYQERDWSTYRSDYMGDNHHYFVIRNEENREIESSCEILIRDCWVKKLGESKTVSAKCAVIGSVFTSEKYRGKGNASFMMKELNKLLDTVYCTGERDVAFLYSEIGNYYEQFGYKTKHVPVYKLNPLDYYQEDAHIYKYDIITDKYDDVINSMNLALTKELSCDGNLFALIPNSQIFDWFNRRSNVTFKAIHKTQEPLVNGFSFIDENGLFNYITFTIAYQHSECNLLSIAVHGKNQQRQLLSLVSQYCIKYNIQEIFVWHTSLDLSATEKQHQNGSISGIRSKIDVDWVMNEKWCWF
ncbi:hypothetical protein CANINC_003938 [Pichia inconspicua]|uniref:N-acetyltransferase domain-containing protein n=1 Tax=Pichia inconspicua TaxID=52247 RepID=A0A4T0WXL2_9ASCO|nr:hypothetical protein CANINC_003938 [[Candida] inconspicua]